MPLPLVTVFIPTHNRAHLIRRAVLSVIDQTYKNIEIIIVNDGSSDNTPDVLNSLKLEYNNISIFQHEKAKGACAARNLAIRNATGEFITGLDDDDEFLPHRISDFVNSINFLTLGYSFLFTSRTTSSCDGTTNTFHGPKTITYELIKNRNYIGNSIFIRRESLTGDLMFDESLPAWQDYDLWFRLIKHYGPARHIKNHTYKVNLLDVSPRISESPSAHHGFLLFIERHKHELTDQQINNHKANDLYNRKVQLSILDSLKQISSLYFAKRMASLYFTTHCPKLLNTLTTTISFLKLK